jgi:hypothetical protein
MLFRKESLSSLTALSDAQWESLKNANREQVPYEMNAPVITLNRFTCKTCRLQFEDSFEQRAHFKCNIHIYNVKSNQMGRNPVSSEWFEDLVSAWKASVGVRVRVAAELSVENLDDILQWETSAVSESSDEDGEKEEKEEGMENNSTSTAFVQIVAPMIGLRIPAVYGGKSLRNESTNAMKTAILHVAREQSISHQWAVFLCSSGHVALAIFKNGKCIAHKTDHFYTIRKKQGRDQASFDATHGKAHSAGAQLRRAGIEQLKEFIARFLRDRQKEIKQCQLIFVKHSRHFVGASNLDPGDPRIRKIPGYVGRPSHAETQRLYERLSTVEIYTSD